MADEFMKAALYGIKTFNKKVKEKIGIEKLIELLNEYEIEKEKSEGVNVDAYVEFKWEWVGEGYLNKGLTRFDETDHWEGDNLYGDTAVAYLISKSFGFIKWLVENDKIDNKKIADETYVKVNGEWYELILGCHYDLYQQTLMLLSISDTPIEDLLLYLK